MAGPSRMCCRKCPPAHHALIAGVVSAVPRTRCPRVPPELDTQHCGGGSGDQQVKAELCRVEIDEVSVAFGLPAGYEVVTEAARARNGNGWHARPPRTSPP
ncbi:hypothetical protein GCM10009525_24250 [Streptosporangium amethystogenes subsp. fukuiense]